MLTRKTRPIDIECVARGYLSGSGWKEYRESGTVCGITLPAGLKESDRLPAPIFTPATKAASGHDINIDEAEATRLLGDAALFARLRDAHARAVHPRLGPRRVVRDHPGRHEIRVRLRRRHAAAHRRGAHARLLALLAGRPVRRRAAPSRASTSSSSATTSSRFAGTSSRPCRRCPTMSWRGRGTSTWTRLPG